MKSYLPLFISVFILYSCAKNPSSSVPVNNASDSSMSAQINGVEWATNNVSITRDSFTNNLTAITGNGTGIIKLGVITYPGFDTGTYNFRPANIDSSSSFVTLSSFKVTRLVSGIDISWGIQSETNLNAFEIERSADGVNFYVIATVGASSNTSVVNYSYLDASPLPTTGFYRLKMLDVYGDEAYSTIAVAHSNIGSVVDVSYDGIPGSNGTITILSNDTTNHITTGTFSFDCVDSSNQLITIRNGKFNIHY